MAINYLTVFQQMVVAATSLVPPQQLFSQPHRHFIHVLFRVFSVPAPPRRNINLQHRVVMAPLTRFRANKNSRPW
jgi:hypothetical protein